MDVCSIVIRSFPLSSFLPAETADSSAEHTAHQQGQNDQDHHDYSHRPKCALPLLPAHNPTMPVRAPDASPTDLAGRRNLIVD